MQTLTLTQPPSLNPQLNKARNSKFGAASDKKKWTRFAARKAIDQLEEITSDTIHIIAFLEYTRTSADPDNLTACMKYVMDGLTLAGIIPNDTVKVVQSPTIYCHSKTKPKTKPVMTLLIFEDIQEWKDYAIKLIQES